MSDFDNSDQCLVCLLFPRNSPSLLNKSLRATLSQDTFMMKQKRVQGHSLPVQHTAWRLLFQEVFKESGDPGVVITSHKPVVFNVDHTA